jgi:hypothetical protein
MKNEFGARLDRSGYAPTLLGNTGYCSLCYRKDRPLQRHEVFHGPFRTASKKYGLWISICDECHRDLHANPKSEKRVKEWAQRQAMTVYKWTEADFRRRFGKSYV